MTNNQWSHWLPVDQINLDYIGQVRADTQCFMSVLTPQLVLLASVVEVTPFTLPYPDLVHPLNIYISPLYVHVVTLLNFSTVSLTIVIDPTSQPPKGKSRIQVGARQWLCKRGAHNYTPRGGCRCIGITLPLFPLIWDSMSATVPHYHCQAPSLRGAFIPGL